VLSPRGVDAVIDASGRGELPVSIELAGGPERVVTIAAYNSADYGVLFAGPEQAAKFDTQTALREAVRLMSEGALEVPVWKTYPLSEAAAAHAASEHAHHRGKIILLPD
jgi:NADPH:quinone reductase-like Zn-dependent oxidoreductase